LLQKRPEILARKVALWDPKPLEEWTARESKLGNATLAAEVRNGNNQLAMVKEWSDAVNQSIEEMVKGVPPFPLFTECLEKMRQRADTMVISQTPAEALEREWAEHGINSSVRLIAGQEMGSKTEHLRFAARDKYAPEKMLMIGDAPGDYKAAKANGALFYPIIPGREEHSWERFHREGLERFFSGRFAGAYETELVEEFDASLPENPPWT
jgi:phosphoglycolate phosphatase-like HAD superfamily hydrolase